MQHTAIDIDPVHKGETLIDLHRQRADDRAIDALCAGTPPNEDEILHDVMEYAKETAAAELKNAKIEYMLSEWLSYEIDEVLKDLPIPVVIALTDAVRRAATKRMAEFLYVEEAGVDEFRIQRGD